MRGYLWLVLIALCTAGPGRADEAWPGRVLRGCDVEDGYPPFAFFGEDRTPRGYTVDLVAEAIAGTGLRLEVRFLPTKRCDASIDAGTFDLDMEDVWTPDYAAHWQPTAAIWDATDAVYFDRTRFPTGLSIEALRAHPMEHRGCGLYGAPYDQFAEGQVDTRSYLFADAFRRMLLGHCEFVPELLEFGAAYRLGGHVLTDHPRIGVARLPLSPRPDMPEKFTPDGRYPLYIYLRKGFPDSRGLVERLNATIASWHRTGKDRAVMSRYIDLALLEQR